MTPTQQHLGSRASWCQELQWGSMEASALMIFSLVPGTLEGPRPVRLADRPSPGLSG